MGKFTYLFMAIAGLYGAVTAIPPTARFVSQLASVGSSPVAAKVADAPVGKWVTLSDAKLRCDTRTVYQNSTTFFLATDAGTASPFVAQFIGTPACEAAQAAVSGVFVPEPMTLADLAQYGIDSKGATALRLFTPIATPKFLRIRLVPSALIMLIGLGMAVFGVRGLLRLRRNPSP